MNRERIHIVIYLFILAIVVALGSRYIRQNFSRPLTADSVQGRTLASVMGYQWSHIWKMKFLPRLPGQRVYQTILIDPGHGGKDPGARGVANMDEKAITLDVGLRLRDILENNGFRVFMTRTTDEFVSLEERVGMIKECKPDVFLSVHANSSSDTGVSGIEVYYAQEEEYWAKVHSSINEALKDSESPVMDTPEELSRPDNARFKIHQQAGKFARHLSGDLSLMTGARNRGIKRAHFYVLSEASIPSVLVEMGFVTNAEEGTKLATEEYRQQLAESLAKGLMTYVEPQQ